VTHRGGGGFVTHGGGGGFVTHGGGGGFVTRDSIAKDGVISLFIRSMSQTFILAPSSILCDGLTSQEASSSSSISSSISSFILAPLPLLPLSSAPTPSFSLSLFIMTLSFPVSY